MKAFLAALMLAAAPVASAPPAAPAPVTPQIIGVVAFEIDSVPQQLVFVFTDGGIYQVSAKDCIDSPACKDEVAKLVAIKHVRIIDVSTGTKT